MACCSFGTNVLISQARSCYEIHVKKLPEMYLSTLQYHVFGEHPAFSAFLAKRGSGAGFFRCFHWEASQIGLGTSCISPQAQGLTPQALDFYLPPHIYFEVP